jgi:hypothetical protein
MKQLYAACGGITSILILFLLPDIAKAQCATCWDASAPRVITYLQTVPPSQASNSPFSFPKFDPSIGTLSCISFNDTVSIVATTFGRNTDTTAGHNYVFQTTVSDAVSGPRNSGPFNWLATFSTANKSYGPVWLDKDTTPRLPGDSIQFGPDTLLNNAIGAGTPPDFAPFIGLGNVDFSADLSGGAVATAGGTNYVAGIRSNSWGSFRLTYYWCPASPLAATIINFSALKADDNVQLKWNGVNEAAGDTYNVEYSTDGVHFIVLASYPADAANPGAGGSYNFQYDIPANASGQIYFRVSKTNAAGEIAYSPVKPIRLNDKAAANYQVYPNPSSKHVYVEWQSLLTGKIDVSVVNMVGQQVYDRTFRFDGSNTVSFDLPVTVTQGNYFLVVKDPANRIQQSSHLVIR